MFRVYSSNLARTAGKGIAVVAMMVGLMLAGLGAMMVAFPLFFIYIAAALCFLAALACMVFALKIIFAVRQVRKYSDPNIIDVEPMQ